MAERFGIAVAILIGVLVRVAPIVGAGGVVGDGGLILALVDDIRGAGLGLPTTASYNDFGIPFVYPPLALWLAAAIGAVSGIETLGILTWMPMVVAVLVLVAFAWLSVRLLTPAAAVAATFAFALMPSAYGWLVAGGGLTRGSGLLFALLATAIVVGPRDVGPSARRAVLAGALLGLAGLAHPQGLLFGALACTVLSIRRPLAEWGRHTAIAGAAAIVVLLPWLAWVGGTNGLDAIWTAGQRLEPVTGLIRLLNLRFSGANFMDIVGAAGVLGLVVQIVRQQWRVPILLLVVSLVGAGGGEFLAAAPWALLAGAGIAAVVALVRSVTPAETRLGRRALVATAAVVLFLALIGALGSVVDSSSKLHPLGDDRVAAMRWLEEEGPDRPVLVPTSEVWGFDDVSEWLPAIADHRSIGTVQGSEWLGSDGFEAQLDVHQAILECAGSTAACYRSLAPDAILFVPKGRLAGLFSAGDCCPALRETLADAGYEIIYDEEGATIAQPRP